MPDKNQASTHDSLPLRLALVRRGWSVTKLARKLKHPRPTVSAAINRGKFPLVLAKIKEELSRE